MKTKLLNVWFLVLFLSSCASPHIARLPGSETTPPVYTNPRVASPDYPLVFQRARELLINSEDKKIKTIPENYVVERLADDPDYLKKSQAQLIAELDATIPKPIDPTTHTRLLPPEGMPGYSDMKLYVNHPYYMGTKLVPASNMIEVWKAFIRSASKEIILNVFDFDLEEVADELIAQAKKGRYVQVGIDKKSVIDVRPEVKAVHDKLVAGGVKVTGVLPVGLNHQKITAIDWSIPKKASVLFSSGNLTRSCLEPEGDLKGTKPLPPESVPNANHFITMKSWVLANLVQHELTKTLSPDYLLRGRDYPINGSYQVTGPGVDPQTFEAYPEPSLTISFTPGGGMKSINKNLIAHFIKRETGKIRMLQFAYSSEEVDKALLFRAEQDYQVDNKFDFLSVGDTPFAMMDWSKFLAMSGMKRVNEGEGKTKKVTYLIDPENAWNVSLGEELMKDVRKKIYIAPKIYGNNSVKIEGKGTKVNAKIHHKILATENYAIIGTSFNFSEGAESNNEQILVFRDKNLAKAVDGMVRYLIKTSPGTVSAEALRRNKYGSSDDEGSDPEDITGGKKPDAKKQ